MKCSDDIPNYSVFNYVDKLPPFSESDRFLKIEINQVLYHNEYELEAPPSRFSDAMLNDHLYLMYKKGQLDNPTVMRKLLLFFVKCYRAKLEPMVTDYLKSNKLSLDEWLMAVKENRWGDIICVLFLSMISGHHTCIHLKAHKLWCTLHELPLLHNELVERCSIHLLYMGFGIFLRLKCRLTPLMPTPPILGHITSDDPQVRASLPQIMIKMELPATSAGKQVTAAADSEAQLSRVEEEMKAKLESKSHKPQVKNTPFSVRLIWLSEHTIQKYTKKAHADTEPESKQCNPSTFNSQTAKTKIMTPSVPELVVKVHRLPLTPGQ